MKRAYKITRHPQPEAPDVLRLDTAPLHNRCANLRQILGATFYLFGFLFFIGLQRAPTTIGDGRLFPIVEVLNNFVLQFVFAANIFFIFLVLHLIQWLISTRLQACAQHVNG